MVTWTLLGFGLLASDVGLDEMRRAVDRAFTAELAGDLAGAEADLRHLVETSTLTGSARIRAATYLESLAERREAFSDHGLTRRGFARAFATLRRSPPRWSDLMWRRAAQHVPDLFDRTAARRVRVRGRRVAGADREEVDRFLSAELRRGGLGVTRKPEADFDLRYDLDVSEGREDRNRHRARAEGSYILRTGGASSAVVGSRALDHEARRAAPEDARAWASRRVLDDIADAVIFDVRLALLERPEQNVSPRR